MYNVLICDDQPDIVNALKIYLSPEGYKLYEAFTGKEALQIGLAEVPVAEANFGKRDRIDPEPAADLLVPCEGLKIQKLCSGCIGIIRCEDTAAGQTEHQPCIDRAQTKRI